MKWLLAVLFSLVFVAANVSGVYGRSGHSPRKPPPPPWSEPIPETK